MRTDCLKSNTHSHCAGYLLATLSKEAYWSGPPIMVTRKERFPSGLEGVKSNAIKYGFDTCKEFDIKSTETQALVYSNEDIIVISFRGTSGKTDVITDAMFLKTASPYGMVHKGFYKAMKSAYPEIVEYIKRMLHWEAKLLYTTGHSLGGALAVLMAIELIYNNIGVDSVYTYGCPRVGSKGFAKRFNSYLKRKYFRYVNNNDIAPTIPYRILGYRHSGTHLYITYDGKIKWKYREGAKAFSWWREFWDKVKGLIVDFGDGNLDCVDDHDIVYYEEVNAKYATKEDPTIGGWV